MRSTDSCFPRVIRRRRSRLGRAAALGAVALLTQRPASAADPNASPLPAVSNPDLTASSLQLVVDISTGDVSLANEENFPLPFTGYDIKVLDNSINTLLVGNPADAAEGTGPVNAAPRTQQPPYTDELLLSEANSSSLNYNRSAAALGNKPSTWILALDGFNAYGSAFGVAESYRSAGISDAITIPVGGGLDLGTIFNTSASQTDLQFSWSPATPNGGNYQGAPLKGTVDYYSPPTYPGNTYWKNSVITGNLSSSANWSAISPTGTDSGYPPTDLISTHIANTDTLSHIVVLDTNASPSILQIDETGGGTDTLSEPYAVFFYADTELLGVSGVGVHTQSAGTNEYEQDLIVGDGTTGTGTYNLSGAGTVTVGPCPAGPNGLFVGYSGRGTFNQSGGTVTLTGGSGNILYLGYGAGSTGTYSLSGGLISAGVEYVGVSGVGTFVQSGNSANTVGGMLAIAANSTYSLSGGTLNAGSVSITGGTLNLNGGTFQSAAVNVQSGGMLAGYGTVPGATTVNSGGRVAPGTGKGQPINFTAGLDFSGGGIYDWQIASPLSDNNTGIAGSNFSQVHLTGGNLTLGGSSVLNVDTSQLTAGNMPGGPGKNAFWNASHIWTVAQVSGSGTNAGATNFASITNGSYPTGIFATQINPDGKSIDLVYNEMNLTAGSANGTIVGSFTLSGGNTAYGPAATSAGDVTLGSVDIHGLNPSNDSPVTVLLDVKGTSAAIQQWYLEMSGAQTGGADGYTVSQIAVNPSGVPAGDTAFEFIFTNLLGTGDRYINFDWTAGDPGVQLDEVQMVPEPSLAAPGVILVGALLLRRTRRATLSGQKTLMAQS